MKKVMQKCTYCGRFTKIWDTYRWYGNKSAHHHKCYEEYKLKNNGKVKI